MFGALFSILQEEADKFEKALIKDPVLQKQFLLAVKAIEEGGVPPDDPEFKRKLLELLEDGKSLVEESDDCSQHPW